ncbi:hypothetical protein FJZ31_07215 [Candidatus Poribacteria bacterium]|nr:hypothetical protein [Candidatus Poribacteria bacterium]
MTMTELSPTLDEWSKLYQAVIRVKKIAPWEWMTETDIFGVQNPETNQLGFISFMGMLGEHFAVAVYLNPEGLYSFWGFQRLADTAPSEVLFEVLLGLLHLQASFENRNELHQKDRDLIKELGLKFRGRQAWPMFRSYRPGFCPWYLEAWEVCFLTHALEQAAEVALRFKDDSTMLDTSNDSSYLVRAPRKEKGTLVWTDRIVTVPPPEAKLIPIKIDVDALAAVEKLPQVRQRFEMDCFILPTRIAEKDTRPFFPYMLLLIESNSGMILSTELLQPHPSLEVMWGSVPMTLVSQFARFGVLPSQISVRSPLLIQLLQPLAEALGFELKATPVLRSLDQARESLRQVLA